MARLGKLSREAFSSDGLVNSREVRFRPDITRAEAAANYHSLFAQSPGLLEISECRGIAEAISVNKMGSEVVRFKIGHTYNLHNGHEYFKVVAISAQFATFQRIPPADWDEEMITFCEKQFKPFRRKIRHGFYKRGVDSVKFGYNTIFADAEVPPGKPFVPRLVRLGDPD